MKRAKGRRRTIFKKREGRLKFKRSRRLKSVGNVRQLHEWRDFHEV